MKNLVETELKFQKLKHIGAFACTFDRCVSAFFYVFHGAPPCQLIYNRWFENH
jgi:hypothetical protein